MDGGRNRIADMRLRDRKAFITGASRGLGLAMVEQLAEQDHPRVVPLLNALMNRDLVQHRDSGAILLGRKNSDGWLLLDPVSEAEQQQRERSDFLTYQDSDGRYADFHALRHTYLSRLGRSCASPKAIQRLARHTSVELTLGRYTHANLYDLASAVDGMPALPIGPSSGDVERQSMRATGTDDLTGSGLAPKSEPTGSELARTGVL